MCMFPIGMTRVSPLPIGSTGTRNVAQDTSDVKYTQAVAKAQALLMVLDTFRLLYVNRCVSGVLLQVDCACTFLLFQ